MKIALPWLHVGAIEVLRLACRRRSYRSRSRHPTTLPTLEQFKLNARLWIAQPDDSSSPTFCKMVGHRLKPIRQIGLLTMTSVQTLCQICLNFADLSSTLNRRNLWDITTIKKSTSQLVGAFCKSDLQKFWQFCRLALTASAHALQELPSYETFGAHLPSVYIWLQRWEIFLRT